MGGQSVQSSVVPVSELADMTLECVSLYEAVAEAVTYAQTEMQRDLL